MEFRTLNANEIECRVKTITKNGCLLLLYKDARADMNLLDETVGPENWQRSHEVVNGNLFCNVGINVNHEGGFDHWVWKQDVGTESYTEAEKGQASDAFKRACFNWGIGRELYTAPMIWIPSDCVNLKQDGQSNKWTTNDRFRVKQIEYDDRKNIVKLVIFNNSMKKVAFNYGMNNISKDEMVDPVEEAKLKSKVLKYVNDCGMSKENIEKLCAHYGRKSLQELTTEDCTDYLKKLEDKKNE